MQAAALITFVKKQDDQRLDTLGERLKWARAQRSRSQTELAKSAGVSQGTIGNIEAGVRQKPRELNAIARALKVSADWLETGRGVWDAVAANEPSLFDVLTEEERELLDDFRSMADEDRSELADEIKHRAEKMRAHVNRVLAGMGLPARKSANADRGDSARVTSRLTDRLKQRSLLGDESQ